MNFYATMQARSSVWDYWQYDTDEGEQDEEEPRDSLSPLDEVCLERERALYSLQRPCSMEQRG